MRIKNKKKAANYVNYKVGGFAKKAFIPAGKTIELPFLKTVSQIINIKDFNLGFLEVVEDAEMKKPAVEQKKITNKEDALDKVIKEVNDYTDNKE